MNKSITLTSSLVLNPFKIGLFSVFIFTYLKELRFCSVGILTQFGCCAYESSFIDFREWNWCCVVLYDIITYLAVYHTKRKLPLCQRKSYFARGLIFPDQLKEKIYWTSTSMDTSWSLEKKEDTMPIKDLLSPIFIPLSFAVIECVQHIGSCFNLVKLSTRKVA